MSARRRPPLSSCAAPRRCVSTFGCHRKGEGPPCSKLKCIAVCEMVRFGNPPPNLSHTPPQILLLPRDINTHSVMRQQTMELAMTYSPAKHRAAVNYQTQAGNSSPLRGECVCVWLGGGGGAERSTHQSVDVRYLTAQLPAVSERHTVPDICTLGSAPPVTQCLQLSIPSPHCGSLYLYFW